MKTRTYVILIVALIFISLLILVKNYNENIIGAAEGDNINLEDLKVCCEYVNEEGETKTCSIRNRYDCSLCSCP